MLSILKELGELKMNSEEMLDWVLQESTTVEVDLTENNVIAVMDIVDLRVDATAPLA